MASAAGYYYWRKQQGLGAAVQQGFEKPVTAESEPIVPDLNEGADFEESDVTAADAGLLDLEPVPTVIESEEDSVDGLFDEDPPLEEHPKFVSKPESSQPTTYLPPIYRAKDLPDEIDLGDSPEDPERSD